MSMSGRSAASPGPSTSIIDILDRVLDKGLVVAGDISISLASGCWSVPLTRPSRSV